MNSSEFYKKSLPLAIASALTLISPTAFTQDSGKNAKLMEEVIVTARKRDENLMEVPIAISAYSQEELRKANAFGLEDVAELTPGLQFRNFGALPEPVIRGLAQTDQGGLISNVGVFIDGIYLNNRSSIDFGNMDVAQIEVLKGPQSALFGRNTFAGAINYTSNPAVLGEFDGSIELDAGSDGLLGAKASFSIPIGENVAVRLFAGTSEYDGTIKNSQGSNLGGWEDRTTYGVSGLFDNDTVRVKLFYVKNEIQEQSPPALTLDYTENNGGAEFIGNDGVTTYYSVFAGSVPTIESASADPRASGIEGYFELAYLNVDYDLGPATLTANISTSESKYSTFSDNNGNPDLVNQTFFGIYTRLWFTDQSGDLGEQDSYELRLASNEGSAFDWLIGVSRYENTTGGSLGTIAALAADPTQLVRITKVDERLNFDSDAYFAAVDIPITDRFSINAEYRYTSEDLTDFDEAQIFFLPLFNRAPNEATTSFSYSTGRIGMDFNWSEDTLIYAYAAKGVKTGGINNDSGSGVLGTNFDIYLPEENITYELGLKTTFNDGRGQLNSAIYYIDWTDLQTLLAPTAGGPPGAIFNGSGATSKGIEFDLTYDLTDHLEGRIGATFIDANYDDDFVDNSLRSRCGLTLPPTASATLVSGCSTAVGGNQIARISDTQYYLGVTYTMPTVISDYDGYMRATYSYESEKSLTSLNLAEMPDIALLNLRAGISNEKTELAIWVDNATDEDYLASAVQLSSSPAEAVCTNCGLSETRLIQANGRSFGVEYVVRF